MSELQHTAIQRSADFWRRNPSPAQAMKRFDRMVILSGLAKSSDGTVFLGKTPYLSRREAALDGSGGGTSSPHSSPPAAATKDRYIAYHSKIMGRQYPSYEPQLIHGRSPSSSAAAAVEAAAADSGGDAGADAASGDAAAKRPPSHLRQKGFHRPLSGAGQYPSAAAEAVGFAASPTAPFSIRTPRAAADNTSADINQSNVSSGGGDVTPPQQSLTARSPSATTRGTATGGHQQPQQQQLFVGKAPTETSSATTTAAAGPSFPSSPSQFLQSVRRQRDSLRERIRSAQRSQSPTMAAPKASEQQSFFLTGTGGASVLGRAASEALPSAAVIAVAASSQTV